MDETIDGESQQNTKCVQQQLYDAFSKLAKIILLN